MTSQSSPISSSTEPGQPTPSASSLGRLLLVLTMVVGAGVIAGLPGCSDSSPSSPPITPSSFSDLKKHSESTDTQLKDELARIEGSQGLPRQLAGEFDVAELGVNRQPTSDSRDPTTEEIRQLLTQQQLKWLPDRLDKLFPHACITIDDENAHDIRGLLTDYASQTTRLRQAMNRSDFGLSVPSADGPLIKWELVDIIESFVRLECLQANLHLYEQRIDAAMECVNYGTSLIAHLARLHHVVPRTATAWRREDVLRSMQNIANHPLANRSTLAQLSDIVGRQLANWPNTRRVLVQERADGLVTYEILRNEMLQSLLSIRERKLLEKNRRWQTLALHIHEQIDADEVYYLETMRRYIDAAELPFHARNDVFQSIQERHQRLENAANRPRWAIEYQLADLELAQARWADELNLARALQVALSSALNPQVLMDPLPISPVTGTPLEPHRTSVAAEITQAAWHGDETVVRVKYPKQ